MKQKLKAYSAALAVFIVMTTAENLYLRYHPLMTGQDLAIFIFNLSGFLSFMVPGYVAALMIHQQRLVTGTLAGLLVGCGFYFYVFLFRHAIYHDWYCGLTWGALLGGIGGLLASFQAFVLKRVRSAEYEPGDRRS